MAKLESMNGMTAAAYAAYALSDAAMIFPITPASHMAETIETWSVEGKKNLFGQPVEVKEMQSEKGVAGALHGSLAGGALTTTFTASQGLMLMIPNMYKVSGELLPGVFHVTSRSLAAHALSIFGDHQDVMAVRTTGVAMLASTSVQECMDLSWVVHLSAIEGSLPFVHFFDGFRTSDAVETIEPIETEQMIPLINWEKIQQFRKKCLEPERPEIRGTAQNPDVYFQNREAPNTYYDALPDIVQANMDKIAAVTGRSYHLFDYVGAPDAERVIVTMASSCDVVEPVVRFLNAKGEKVGLVKVRLFRPFSAKHLIAALPKSVKVLCALDRTKEPGAQGEPLMQDVCMAVQMEGWDVKVVGGRYGLSSKDFTPAMALAVFDNMRAEMPKARFTVGITDDVTHLSLSVGPALEVLPSDMKQYIFYGCGGDGTVGAIKQATKIVGDNTGLYSQGYSWFDSKKSDGLSISYVRFGKDPIQAPYLIDHADYVACHKDIYTLYDYPLIDKLKDGGVFVLNSQWTKKQMNELFPARLKRAIATKHVRFFNIDAAGLAVKFGLGARINLIMEAVFFKLAGVMDYEKACELMKEQVKSIYRAKGPKVVQADLEVIDQALEALEEIDYPHSWAQAKDPAPAKRSDREAPAWIEQVYTPITKLEGESLPVSALDPAGFVPLGSSAYDKRRVAFSIPEWDREKCVQCYECSLVCPHAAIRPVLARAAELEGAPASFKTKPATFEGLEGYEFRIQVYPEDCVGCGSCADNCPAPGKALVMKELPTQLDDQKANLAFAQENISIKDELIPADTIPGTQLQQPLLEFSGCCGGCGETPHVKLLTQLFGDRLIMANATGCSSIWGAYMPSMPYCKNRKGHGPAWGNSLFEDNGEYGFGIAKAVKIRRQHLVDLVNEALTDKRTPANAKTLMTTWLAEKDDPDAAFSLGQAIQAEIRGLTDQEPFKSILDYAEMFGKKSVWAVGGDGWAYDIDYGGIDEVLASKENINVLVLDTEGYSNTGGEMSKATQLGSVSGFSQDGKPTPKKNLGRMMMQYGYVYVASVCLGADKQQVITAMREAEAYDGPSIVICLCPCISWDIHGGMATNIRQARHAVEAGYWPLFRFNPDRVKEGKDPLTIDYSSPDGSLADFLNNQGRYASLGYRKPELSRRLQSELAKDCEIQYEQLEKMVGVYEPTGPKRSAK